MQKALQSTLSIDGESVQKELEEWGSFLLHIITDCHVVHNAVMEIGMDVLLEVVK